MIGKGGASSGRWSRESRPWLRCGLNESLRASEQGQFSDRFGRAVEELGSQELEVRLGGIYALGQLAHDSRQDAAAITNVLAEYVRDRAPATGPCTPEPENKSRTFILRDQPTPPPPAADIQAAVTVLGQRDPATATPVDLSGTCLGSANLENLNLPGVNLTKANLTDAHLTKANLTKADLKAAHFTGASLIDANLTGASFSYANLTGANLTGADLTSTNLIGADLTSTNLIGADLTDAYLTGANLIGADLTGTNLTAVKRYHP